MVKNLLGPRYKGINQKPVQQQLNTSDWGFCHSLLSHYPKCFAPWGVVIKKMASRNDTTSKLPKTFKEVSKLTKPKLKEICKTVSVDCEKSVGRKALINLVCNALNISTSGICQQSSRVNKSDSADTPTLPYLQKLKGWQKSLKDVTLKMEESIVKTFLLGAGYDEKAVRKYKTLRALEHKQGIHSVK